MVRILSAKRAITTVEIESILLEHKMWLDTEGNEGKRADFSDTQLCDIELVDAYLAEACFIDADLQRVDFSGANLDKAEFNHANLRWAILDDVRCTNAIFTKADLSEATLHNAYLGGADFSKAILSGADFSGAYLSQSQKGAPGANLDQADLEGANFFSANLRGAILTNTNLFASGFEDADLTKAKLNNACLDHAVMFSAKLRGAILHKAKLRDALLCGADLSLAEFHGANMSDANLQGAILVQTELIGANLSNARVYGISAWDVKAKGSIQNNLVVTPAGMPPLEVSDLEMAQFLYFILDNRKIRQVIDTVASKVVLILGRFTPERKTVLNALAKALINYNLVPVLFDFEGSKSRDFTETVKWLAGMSLFVLADITAAKSTPHELAETVKEYQIPFIPIVHEDDRDYSMFKDHQKYNWVAEPQSYSSTDKLIKVIKPAIIDKAFEMNKRILKLKSKRLEIKSVNDYLQLE